MQKLQLSIPEPCHENWQQMTPTEQGRFCNACAKEVIDFSTMTDIQVLNYFTNLTHEKVCGRALPEQLDRTIGQPEPPKKRLFWYWNYIVMFFMFFTKGNAAKAQVGTKTTTCTQTVTAAEPEKVKQTDINKALEGRVGGFLVITNKIVTGKVTDKVGNPVPFASVKIKGTPTGVAADANGAYSLKTKSNTILVISGSGFKATEVLIGAQTVLNTVLETDNSAKEIIITIAGGIRRRNMDDYVAPLQTKTAALIKVQDAETSKSIPNASVVINSSSSIDTVLTDKKGEHKIKGIKNYESYFVKVTADGYEANEFTIDGSDFKDRKKEWEVLLKKKPAKFLVTGKAENQNVVRIGGVSARMINEEPIYVVDGTIINKANANSISPADIDNIEVLNGPSGAALFGPEGANGAILITTKKLKVKNLDTLAVTAVTNTRLKGQISVCKSTVMGATIEGVTIRNSMADSVKMLATKISGAIKISPNPVQRGQHFNIALKLKEAGIYQILITDATGKSVLQKQLNANSKEVTETIIPDNRWSSGLYYLNIIDSKDKIALKTSFIFE